MSRRGHHIKTGDLVWFWMNQVDALHGTEDRYQATGIVLDVWDSNVYEPSETEVYTSLPGSHKTTVLIRTRDVHLVQEVVEDGKGV